MKKSIRTLTPKLRFPEFRDKSGWRSKRLDNVGRLIRGLTYSSKDVAEDGLLVLRASNIQDDRLVLNRDLVFVKKECNDEQILNKGDIAICMSNGSKALVGKNAEYKGDYDKPLTVGAFCSIFRPDDSLAKYLLQTPQYIRFIAVAIGGGNINNLRPTDLESLKFPVPTLDAEQQKIAECLSSLDGLIAAEDRMLEALKAHKKGLMQQLFPQPGQTQPRLRFPEFQDKEAWELDDFDELVEIIDGDRGVNYPEASDFSDSGYCLFLNAKNVTKNGFKFDEMQFITREKDEALRKGKLQRADVVLTTRGSVGQFAYFSERIPYNNMRINSGMVILRVKSQKIRPEYMYAFCKSERLGVHINDIAFGNAQQQLTVAGIKKFPLNYPAPDEQQKIADCLSSIDALITAQEEKIDSLKTHKRGLMQQLFPAPEEQ